MKKVSLLFTTVIFSATCFACGCGCWNYLSKPEPSFAIKDWSPTIVAVVALVLNYLWLERQRKTLIATTVDKDWIEKVRGYVGTIILHASTYSTYVAAKYSAQNPAPKSTQDNFDFAYAQFTASIASLGLYLDVNSDTKQIELYNLITTLSDRCMKGATASEIISLVQQVRYAAQEIIKSKQVK